MKEKDIERLTADAELWESRQLGASAEHVRVVSDEEEKEIDAGLGVELISIRSHNYSNQRLTTARQALLHGPFITGFLCRQKKILQI